MDEILGSEIRIKEIKEAAIKYGVDLKTVAFMLWIVAPQLAKHLDEIIALFDEPNKSAIL